MVHSLATGQYAMIIQLISLNQALLAGSELADNKDVNCSIRSPYVKK